MKGQAKTKSELLAEIEVLRKRLAGAEEALGERQSEESPKSVREEGKQIEETLSRYGLLADHSRDIILFIRRDDGRILEANRAAASAYGYSRREFLTLTIHDLRSIEAQAPTLAQMAEADAQGILFETVHRRKDGGTFPVEVSSRGATIGDLRILISVIRDITERRRAEEAVHSAALFPEQNPFPVLRVARDGGITYANRASAPLLDSWGCLTRDGISEEVRVRVARAVDTGEIVRFEAACGPVIYEISVTPIPSLGYANLYGMDVTAHKRAEQALRESREDLNRAQAVARVGSWRLDVRRNTLLWSDETYRIFGITKEMQLTYESFLAKIHPEDREYVDRKWTAALGGERYDIEHRIVVGDTIKWVREKAELEFDQAGALRGGFGTVQDITERKVVQEDLRRQREWLRVTLTSIGDAVMAADNDGRITFLNPVASALTGWRQDEALGREIQSVFRIINEKTRRPADDIVMRVLNEGCIVNLANHTALVTRDGREVPVEDSAAPIRDSAGNVSGVVLVFHDVTERRRAREALQRRTALLQGINKVLRESILHETEEELAKTCLAVAQELTGSRFGFIGEIGDNGLFNNLALSDTGWAACGMSKSEATRLGHNMEIRGIWGGVLKDEKPLIVNDPSSHPDRTGVPEGHPPIRAFMGVPLKNGDKTFGMIALANKEQGYEDFDVDAVESLAVAFVEALSRRRAQEMLRRAHDELEIRVAERTDALRSYMAKLERSNRDLQDFAFVASHDLQEPLRKIQAFAGRLQDSHFDDKERDYLERMRRAAGRMQDLLMDLLKYSRVTIRPEPFVLIDLKQSVKEAVLDLTILRKETGGAVEVGELPGIEADPVQMRQLFQNLIGNGLKYHGSRKPVIKVYCDPSCHAENEHWTIYVEDNGIGFEERFLEKIFKPFQRLHGADAKYRGTGMGLAICRRIVERHGGTITAKSEPGKGATFIVNLPRNQAKTQDMQ